MRLIIAEKPSVAQTIAKVLGSPKRHEGYVESGGCLISWCVGHLAGLAEAPAYDEKYTSWKLEDLPILPQEWKYTVFPNTRQQFDTLKSLMADSRVTEVINACDAGREGELIFRLVYQEAGCQKPALRLWTSSLEEKALREGLENLQDEKAFEPLYHAALCRAKADWLVGINASRIYSILYHTPLNIGRVLSPTLAMVVERERRKNAFLKEKFYVVLLDCGEFQAEGEKLSSREQAEAVETACANCPALVKSLERREKKENPPPLFDLTTLQREANRLFGYTAQETLDYTQALYEKKLATYPRTDSRYLTGDMEAGIPALLSALAERFPYTECAELPDCGRICDSAKVSDHHAILPTQGAGQADLKALPIGERMILSLLASRLACAVGQSFVSAETKAKVECGGHIFHARGREVLSPGWKAAEQRFIQTLKEKPEKEKEIPLPPLTEGLSFFPSFVTIAERETSPPKRYTEDTLLAAMETAGAEDMPEEAERRGIGTPATRAATIEKLVKTGLMERKGKSVLPTAKGTALVSILPEALASPQLTAEWETALSDVAKGKQSPAAFLSGIGEMVREIALHPGEYRDGVFPDGREVIGACPRCGGKVFVGKSSYYCGEKCQFSIWPNDLFFTSKKVKLTKEQAAALLKKGRVSLKGLYSEKTGKTYDADVLLHDTGGRFVRYKLEFPEKTGKEQANSKPNGGKGKKGGK